MKRLEEEEQKRAEERKKREEERKKREAESSKEQDDRRAAERKKREEERKRREQEREQERAREEQEEQERQKKLAEAREQMAREKAELESALGSDLEAAAERERVSRAHGRKRGVDDEQLQLAFDVLAEGSSALPKEKLGMLLAVVGKCVTKEELDKLTRRSGSTLTVDEVGALLDGEFPTKVEVEVECSGVFDEMDTKGTGKVAADALRTVLTTMGDKLDDKMVDRLLDEVAGGLSRVDYKKLIKQLLAADPPAELLA